jgi:hypothetical protein
MTDLTTQLATALDRTGTAVAGIAATSGRRRRPAVSGYVRTEANHLVGGLRIFAAQLAGDAPSTNTTAPTGLATTRRRRTAPRRTPISRPGVVRVRGDRL